MNEDGVDHINIYSKGETELGRMLSNFAHTPFVYKPYGQFQSVEGFWYWYLTGQKHEQLRKLYGWKAKEFGKTIRDDRLDKDGLTDEQKQVILEAIRCKLRQNRKIVKLLRENTLPFAHYYVYGGKQIYKPEYDWIVEEFERIGGLLKQNLKTDEV